MTKRILLTFLLGITITSYTQKVNLDREKFRINYIKLPTDPIHDKSKHTYSITSNEESAKRNFKLYGFEKVLDNGNVKIDFFFDSTTIESLDIHDEKHEKKNKEGKVIKTWYTYQAKLRYKSTGTVTYSSPNTEGEKSYSISEDDLHTKTFDTYKQAEGYINTNKYSLRGKFKKDFIIKKTANAQSSFNRKYGYEDWWHTELFWILDSESNPDYAGHKKALKDIESIFGKIKIDSKVKDLTPEVEKLEEYFLSIIPKYPKSKRKHRKMKYASYFNLAKLYLTIENFDKAREYAQKIIDNDYDKRDGKKIIKTIDAVKKALETNKMTTRHFKVEIPNSNTAEDPSKG